MSSTDRIVKKARLNAPVERVWDALSDSKKFGRWFGARFDQPFVAGAHMSGTMAPTEFDPEVAKMQEPHKGLRFDVWIVEMTPLKRLSFRWQAHAPDPGTDMSSVPMTLATFELEAVDGGTELTITESGFDQITPEKREEIHKNNEGGWILQLTLIQKFLDAEGRNG